MSSPHYVYWLAVVAMLCVMFASIAFFRAHWVSVVVGMTIICPWWYGWFWPRFVEHDKAYWIAFNE